MNELLTEEQMLLLDNLMYWEEITGDYESVGELIDTYENGEVVLESATLSGGFEKEERMFHSWKTKRMSTQSMMPEP